MRLHVLAGGLLLRELFEPRILTRPNFVVPQRHQRACLLSKFSLRIVHSRKIPVRTSSPNWWRPRLMFRRNRVLLTIVLQITIRMGFSILRRGLEHCADTSRT